MSIYEGAMERIPALETVEVQSMVNGPECFTEDLRHIIGEAPNLDGLFLCTGMNSTGIASAGGLGYALAEWIVAGEPTMDLTQIDVRRFGPHSANLKFIEDRVKETMGLHFQMPWPRKELKTSRNLRHSALY